MYHFFEAIQNKSGDALPGYLVKLFDSSGTIVPIYSDSAGTPIVNVSGIDDTAVVADDGNVALYVNPGVYSLGIYSPSGAQQKLIQDYAMGFQVITTSSGSSVNLRSLIAAIVSPVGGQSAILTEPGREGTFVFDSSDLSAQVTADPLQGIYVAPSTDTSGASGAWVRKTITITPFMFGAVGDGATNDLTALQAMSDFYFNDGTVFYDFAAEFSGNFAINGQLSIGPNTADNRNGRRRNVGGNLRLIQLNSTQFITCMVRNLGTTAWKGSITAQGVGSTSYASRTNGYGIVLDNCAMQNFTGNLMAFNFRYWGVWAPSTGTSFNDGARFSLIRCFYCGSGVETTGASLKANWSSPANSGVSGSPLQLTTLTVDAIPDAAIETYEAPGSAQIMVRINGVGQPRYVQSWNRTAGTISVYPWLSPADITAGSGTLTWIFGGAFGTDGGDSGVMQIGHLNANSCGIGFGGGSLYGTRIGSMNASGCGTGIALGSQPNGSSLGNSIDAYYPEGNKEDIVVLNSVSVAGYGYIKSGYNIDPSKCWALGDALLTSGALGIEGGALGTDLAANVANTGAMAFPVKGRMLTYAKRPLTALLTTVATFRDQSAPPQIRTQNLNSQTVTLSVVGSGEYNRLFGYNGNTWRYVGTGTNGAPTGSFTFTPPTGGTVNGGATNANATFSGPFDGPVDFEILHTDTAQLTWLVRVVAGQPRQNITALGYSSGGGAGATATQVTSKSTAVPLNRVCGQITMSNAALAANAVVSFTFNNTQIAATDELRVWIKSGNATAGTYRAWAEGFAAGSCTIVLQNISAGSLSEAVVLGFALFKSATT